MQEMALEDFISQEDLEEKLFIVPTRRIGLLMINNIAKQGGSVLNTNPITIKRLSEEICSNYMEENNIVYIDNMLGKTLILDCLNTLSKEGDFFFGEDLIDERTAEEVYKVVVEFKTNRIVDIPKEKDLDRIYKLYNEELERVNGMDFCDIMEKALELDELEEYKNKIIGVAENIEFHNLEEEFFKALNSDGNVVKVGMPVQKLMESPKEYFFQGEEESLNLGKEVSFFTGYGISNEINYIIEDMLRRNLPLDEVVIAYTDKKYVPALDLEFKKEGLGINFSDGLDILQSSSYRFIKTVFDFARRGYNVLDLKPIFFNNSLSLEDLEISSREIYKEFLEGQPLYNRASYSILEEETRENTHLGVEEWEAGKRWTGGFVNSLLEAIPKGRASFKIYIERLVLLIERYVKKANKYDKESFHAIVEKLRSINHVDLSLGQDEYFDIILSYIEDINIRREGAEPSKVFACQYASAGYTGRKHLYMIGMDSGSLASKVVESPILLDRLKEDISPKLSFSKESYRYKRYKIKEAITGPFETISIGYSNFDTVDVKGKTPSNIYTELKDLYEAKRTYISNDEKLLGKDLVYSGTSLETLGQCSRKAYLQRELHLKEEEEMEFDLDRWLDPLEKGSLVHRILNRFFDFEKEYRNHGKLTEIVNEEVAEAEKETPYILEEVHSREMEEVKEFCRTMYNRQEDSGREILENELSFGIGRNNKRFGYLDPQRIEIGGTSLNIRGAIDRVDVDRKNKTFTIHDYKTGSLRNFESKLRESSGRGRNKIYDYSNGQKFQFFIYMKALEGIIREDSEFKDYRIESFSYEFLDDSLKLEFTSELLEEIEGRIKGLLDLDIRKNDKRIVFDEEDFLTCRYCEFKNICRTDSEIFKEERGEA